MTMSDGTSAFAWPNGRVIVEQLTIEQHPGLIFVVSGKPKARFTRHSLRMEVEVMRRMLFAAMLCVAVCAYAQRGGHGGGHAGGPPSMANNSSGHGASGSNHGSNTLQPSSGPKSPQELLNQNSKLTSRLQKLLPSTMTPQQACSGFRNLGQCVAAIHVSHNLGIPFADLQTKMTGPNSVSLGKAIQELKPDVKANDERKKAEKEAHDDMTAS
ncbi:MAG TPA: hypothetical protein VEW69_09305 [Alphaproteobacteria bacterium]|nr:hypothetical protein [Alphaproteobacteria bacterium]